MSITIPCVTCGGTMRVTETDDEGWDVIECVVCLNRVRLRAVPPHPLDNDGSRDA